MIEMKLGQEILNVNWDKFLITTKKLALDIKDSGINFRYVTGVPRGGIPLAITLSHMLKLQYIEFPGYPDVVPEWTLVCDDISDSGLTMSDSMKLFNNRKLKTVYSAVLFHRDTSKYVADFVGYKLYHDKWLKFPWEVTDAKT